MDDEMERYAQITGCFAESSRKRIISTRESARGFSRRELIGAARDRQGGATHIFTPSLPPPPPTWDIKTIMYDVGNFRTVGRTDASYDALLKCVSAVAAAAVSDATTRRVLSAFALCLRVARMTTERAFGRAFNRCVASYVTSI